MAMNEVMQMQQNWLIGLYPEIMQMREIENMLSSCNDVSKIKHAVSEWIWNVIDEMEARNESDETAEKLRAIAGRIEEDNDIERVKNKSKMLLKNYAIDVIEWEEKLMKEKFEQLNALKRASLGE